MGTNKNSVQEKPSLSSQRTRKGAAHQDRKLLDNNGSPPAKHHRKNNNIKPPHQIRLPANRLPSSPRHPTLSGGVREGQVGNQDLQPTGKPSLSPAPPDPLWCQLRPCGVPGLPPLHALTSHLSPFSLGWGQGAWWRVKALTTAQQ